MSGYAIVILFTCTFLAAVVVSLITEPKISKYVTVVTGVLALIGGALIYGNAFASLLGSLPLAVLRTIHGVLRMFVGEVDVDQIESAPFFANQWVVILFWIIQIMAFYTTSTTAISLIGSGALKKLRLRYGTHKELCLIYGANADSLDLAEGYGSQRKMPIVFVDESPEPGVAEAIQAMDAVLRSDTHALSPDLELLKSLGIRKGSRKVTLYALSRDVHANMRYAADFLEALEKRGVDPDQASLVLHGPENERTKALQVSPSRYGYGFITIFQDSWQVSRMLIQEYPPCNYVTFDADGVAQEDFEALIIGFGRLGQAVLRRLVMHGQFVGSDFRASVFDPNYSEVYGSFVNSCRGVLEEYDITFHAHDGRSSALYDHIRSRGRKLKYIVVASRSEENNSKIAEDLWDFVRQLGLEIPVIQCSFRTVRATEDSMMEDSVSRLYHPKVLASRNLDTLAMILNHRYQGENGLSPKENWMNCDYFSRMSCRAFADNMDAVLRAAGKTAGEAVEGGWTFTRKQLQVQGEMEHKRWCAFHLCMGYRPMSPEEFDARAEEYQRQLAQGLTPNLRIGKNTRDKTHCCLIPWESLDELSARENRITGKSVDYKYNDISNILAVPELLEALQKENQPD